MILHPSFVLPVMPQETPVSYASRVALGIGCSFRALCKRTDIPLQKLYDGSPEAIALLCHVCQLPQDTFAASTFVTASGRRLTLAGQMLSTDQVNRDALRICAVCVEQQLAEGRGFNEIASPREWSITPLHVCDIHSVPMLTIAEPSTRLRPDFAARLRDAWREGLARPDSIRVTVESGLGPLRSRHAFRRSSRSLVVTPATLRGHQDSRHDRQYRHARCPSGGGRPEPR